MLPPKLAQILVNSVQAQTVYDPFCGTGVIPQEALLLGRTASGSDLSDEIGDGHPYKSGMVGAPSIAKAAEVAGRSGGCPSGRAAQGLRGGE